MRVFTIGLITLAALSAVPAFADSMDNMKGMAGMSMTKSKAAPASKTGNGTGVITAIDIKASKLTIKHGPIAAVGWPGMTMAFKANPPFMLKGLKVGDKISFTMKTTPAGPEVTAIR
ncbi:MAG: copper-binding protein [Alphaproteobacteria bacterium]|nr:copper-binding protein [Alphaproteobacteria bacterium]MDE2340802.1 copper-binding protein [Alphaproteobacteria bacterium]